MKAREILAVVIMSALAIIAIVLIDAHDPKTDHTGINTMIIGFIATITNSLVNSFKASDNAKKLDDMHSDLRDTAASVEILKATPPPLSQATLEPPPSVTTNIVNEEKP